ncbi:MAG: hypothetical protein JRE70_10150 [Deltaproteobacteria bacterium]|nr:hypothetical protein [Deltaproteobacteria bacterium]
MHTFELELVGPEEVDGVMAEAVIGLGGGVSATDARPGSTRRIETSRDAK